MQYFIYIYVLKICTDLPDLTPEMMMSKLMPKPKLNPKPVPKPKDKFVADVIRAIENDKKITRKMANITLVGLPDVGKTALVARILGKSLQKSYSSTGISEPVVLVDYQVYQNHHNYFAQFVYLQTF